MEVPRFAWDENKALANRQKHGVTFEEAKTVFYDNYACLVADPDASTAEERFLLLGLSSRLRLLLVCHCYREAGQQLRIIFSP